MLQMTTTHRRARIQLTLRDLHLPAPPGREELVARVLDTPVGRKTFEFLSERARGIDVGAGLEGVVTHFRTPPGGTPAGFRRELGLREGAVVVDLVRDIGCGENGRQRPTNVLYSADSANPYEVEPLAPFISNLTCNPGIIYDLFLNNPEANIGGRFRDRDDVMTELGRILGPGCDISVELNNPFEEDFSKILEEAARFREILSPWRVVIKVPHTGPVNPGNVGQLLQGDGGLDVRFSRGATKDCLRGHNLALRLAEEGYRVNFTLMFEPYQTQLALQARPYFINAFIRHRKIQTERICGLLRAHELTRQQDQLEKLRSYLIASDYLSSGEKNLGLEEVEAIAREVLHARGVDVSSGAGDGLDAVRHSLRALRNANLDDTRLIICSMEGAFNYPDIDRLLMEPEFADMTRRIVVTAEPRYLARFASSNQVISYQRRFMKAARGQS